MRLVPAYVRAEYDRLCGLYPELRQWPLRINSRLKRALGRCACKKRWNVEDRQYHRIPETCRIELAPWLLDAEEQCLDTLRHEAAHALAGPENSHNYVWKAWAVKLGATPEATCDTEKAGVKVPERKLYVAACPTCKKVYTRSGKPRNRKVCPKCYRKNPLGADLNYTRRVLASVAAKMIEDSK